MAEVKNQVVDASAIPEHLKAHMAAMASSTAQTDADSMAAASVSIPRISLKGKKFKFIEGGEESAKTDTIDIVILGVQPDASHMVKTFYANGYVAGDTSPPTCSSTNGIAPDAWVQSPQNDRCSTCPKNVFGSATSANGKKTKACRDSKILWVTKPESVNGTVFACNVPVTSLKAMAEYGTFIRKNNFPLSGVITRLSMDEDSEYPMLQFEHIGFLSEQQFTVAVDRNQSKDWMANMPAGPLLEDRSNDKPAAVNLAQASANIAASVGVEVKTINTIDNEAENTTSSVESKVGNW